MSQSQTLLGLLPQLKSMEDNIVSMIMELSIKLANLTDASIFVLVDVPNQRKFSGSQYLVDQYLNGCLAPVGDGNELELQVSVTPAVIPKPNHLRPNDSLVQPMTSTAENLCRPMTASCENLCRPLTSTADVIPIGSKIGSTSSSSFRKRRVGAGGRSDSKKSKNLLTDQEMNMSYDGDDVKNEPLFYDTEVDLTLEAEDNFIFDENNRPTEDFSNGVVDQNPSHFDSMGNTQNTITPQNQHHPLSNAGFASIDPMSPMTKNSGVLVSATNMRFHSHNEMQVVLEDLNLPAQKIEFLQSFHDTEKLFVKGSPETKIVTSLMYDFGKSLHSAYVQYVTANPSLDQLMIVKPFMTVNLDAFLELFPNLRLPDYETIRIENRKPKAFLRRHAENSFNRCMREGLKHVNQDWLSFTM